MFFDKFSNDIIIEFGQTELHPDTFVAIALPISFTTMYCVAGMGVNPSRLGAAIPPSIRNITLNGFEIAVDSIYNDGCRYIAIGY